MTQKLLTITFTMLIIVSSLDCFQGPQSLVYNVNQRIRNWPIRTTPTTTTTMKTPRYNIDEFKQSGGTFNFFGLDRSATANQMGKYRVGLAAAQSPIGPGRKRRSEVPELVL